MSAVWITQHYYYCTTVPSSLLSTAQNITPSFFRREKKIVVHKMKCVVCVFTVLTRLLLWPESYVDVIYCFLVNWGLRNHTWGRAFESTFPNGTWDFTRFPGRPERSITHDSTNEIVGKKHLWYNLHFSWSVLITVNLNHCNMINYQ